MANPAPIRFQYEPETTIRETEQMVPLDEYAHRRLIDLILLYRNRLPDNDADLARMTRTGADWPAVKARLIDEHGAFYASEDGYLRNGRCDEILAGVERSRRQKSDAGKASAARRQAKKDAAQAQPPVPVEPTPVQTEPQQPPPDAPATGVSASPPVNGTMKPEQAGNTIPQDWRPNPEGVSFAVARGRTAPQIEALVRGYVARHDQRGDTSKDWNAGFKVWVLRDLAQNPPLGAPQPMSA